MTSRKYSTLGATLVAFFALVTTATAQNAQSVAATLALPSDAAAPAENLQLQPGFQAELLYSVPSNEQGSWVAMTIDPVGRIIASDQYGKLYRVTPPSISGQEISVEPIDLDIGRAHGLLYAFNSLYVMANEKDAGLYRVRDTNGDDQFDHVEKLRSIPGGGEHGPHAILLSPDGKSLYICAGNHTDLPNPEKSLVPRTWQEDQLLPRMWDARGHAAGKLAPGGWICRIDPDGKEFEVVSIGYRNEFDIAFDMNGELFTYDADMEWDIGTPWYRPTRVNHVTSGSEFGWRSGTGKWPAYYPDSLGSVVDIGPGCPTGITFGTGAKFPAKYQRSLFINDWSYGIIYAIHLSPDGSSYVGQKERFITAAPLAATDIVINPVDGAMYFAVGGRRTQSGLYRVTYTGTESTLPAMPDVTGYEKRHERHQLEALHHAGAEGAVDTAWPYLGNSDRAIRYAARIAIEHQDVNTWRERALQEPNPIARIQAIVSLARAGQGSVNVDAAIKALAAIDWQQLDESSRLDLCRAMALSFIRLGNGSAGNSREAAIGYLDGHFPASSYFLNRELSQLLVFLKTPGVIDRTLTLQENAPTQEQQIQYAYTLRPLDEGWTLPQRQRYFDWFHRVGTARGGASFGGFLRNIRDEAVATLSPSDKEQLKDLLAKDIEPKPPVAVERTKFVKQWNVAELLAEAQQGLRGRDFEKGRQHFAAAGCYKCHRINGDGGITGPDLTGVGRRFNHRDLLEAIIEPSKVISDQYGATQFIMADGRTIIGRVANLGGDGFSVITNMLDPGDMIGLKRADIEEVRPSLISMMPDGLLNTFEKEEILDLLAYLRSGGDPNSDAFAKN